MTRWQGRSLKKPSGGRIWPRRKKRKREMGRDLVEPKLGETERVRLRVRGGGTKLRLLSSNKANITDPKTGTTKPAQILRVIENPADPHFVRRNVITRGALIETELGKARVTSRPGQSGIINAVLVEPKPLEKPSEEKPPQPGQKSEG